MKKLVTTPLTRTIYWATVNEAKGLITGEKKDVTDNAINCVIDHFIYSEDFREKGFTGYEYKKLNGNGKISICVYDDRYVVIKKSVYDEMKEKC
jgi:hypothetical protein